MNAVEINTSFYRPHRRETYEKWARVTPPDFRFSVKVPKSISHGLVVQDGHLDRFLEESTGLGAKLSVYLIQFPPSRIFDQKEAGALFDAIRKRSSVDLACEPRHASWFTPKAENWFTQRQICRVAADPPRAPSADIPGHGSALQYFRLHGTPHIYYSAYNDHFLTQLDARLSGTRQGDSWCIFDNTALGAALENALRLRHLHVGNS